MPATDGTVGVEEASRVCRVSDETIRRRLRRGRLTGAFREGGPASAWRIPIAALVADGFTPSFDMSPGAYHGRVEADDTAALRMAVDAAEAIARERLELIRHLEAHVADLQVVLKVLETR